MKGIVVPTSRISRKEAAELLDLSPVTISGYIRRGKLRAYKNGCGKLYFLRDEVEEYKARSEAVTEVAPKDIPNNTPIAGRDIGLTAVRGKLLTTKEVAALLRTSDRWVQDHMSKGTFPIRWFPIGPRYRVVDLADLNDYLAKIFVEAGTAPLPLKSVKKIKKIKEAAMK